jgi:tRNA (guanine-N7-)-methyltransferase
MPLGKTTVQETISARRIRSYVLRKGRLTSGQAYALKHYWQHYGIDYSPVTLDLQQVFGRKAPRVLDIGVGMGDTSISMAKAHPENDYLAVDVHQPGIGSLLRQAEAANLTNIRVVCNDVIEVLTHQLPNRCLELIYMFFPDPWPKKRHHKRRLISDEFISLLTQKMAIHGRIFIATDCIKLSEHIMTVCDNHRELINMAGKGNAAPRPTWRPLTKFEKRGIKLQHPMNDFIYCLSNDTVQEMN